MKKPHWYRLLEMIRKIDTQIHSSSLAEISGLDPYDASAWLCKLTRWGYLRRAGKSEMGGKTVRYELTTYGQEVGVPREERKFRKYQVTRTEEGLPIIKIAANPGPRKGKKGSGNQG